MFRLAVTDAESGVISVNVSALAQHKYGSSLHASLEAFVSGSPIDYFNHMKSVGDSEERSFNILYYSNLLHELRHFFDFLLTPYGAFTLRKSVLNYQLLFGLFRAGQPVIVPLVRAADPFVGRVEFGLNDFDGSATHKVASIIKIQQDFYARDRKGFRHPTGSTYQFGGVAMLEALAFAFQMEFLSPLRTPNLERIYPAAFADYDVANPSSVDALYRWHAPLCGMIGNSPNEGVVKLLRVITFASLCGQYRRNRTAAFLHNVEDAEPVEGFSLEPALPSKIFAILFGKAINRFEGKTVSQDLDWDGAWQLIDKDFKTEFGRGILESIEWDLEADEHFASRLPDKAPVDDNSIENVFVWYRSLTSLRRRAFDQYRDKPTNLVDPIAQLRLFGSKFPAPIEFVYPQSTNVIFPGSIPINSDPIELPKELAGIGRGESHGRIGRFMRRIFFRDYPLCERVYYSSIGFKGENSLTDKEWTSWQAMASPLRPLLRTILYGHDPHVVLGKASSHALRLLSEGKIKVCMSERARKHFEVEAADAAFDFYQLEQCDCDSCSKPFNRRELRSVSSLTLRSTDKFRSFLDGQSGTLPGHLLRRDWSEHRVCQKCFKNYFPGKLWR